MKMIEYFLFFCLVGWCCPILAERLVIRPDDIGEEWEYPAGALVVEEGRLQPVRFGKRVSASRNAHLRNAGAALASAAQVIDGDRQSAWRPPAGTPLEDWWIEIDLGQVLPVQQIRLYFDADHPPLSFFTLSLSKGERFINSANVVVEGTLLFSRSERYSFNQEHVLAIDLEDELVQAIRLEASRPPQGEPALAEIEVDAFGDNIAFDLIERGGSVDVEAAIVTLAGTPTVMFDGDLVSSWRVSPLAKGSTGGRPTFGDYRVDLGATYWIDTVWLLGEPLGIPPRNRLIYANFLSYQILYSDGSLAPDGSLRWHELAAVPPDDRNLFERRNFRHDVARVAARYLRLFYPTSQGGQIIGGSVDNFGRRYDGLGLVGEFQVYGEGYPARVLLRSPVIDLGAPWNITALEWRATIPPDAHFLLRSRSGQEVVEEMRYYDKQGKEITQRRWEKLIESFRGPVETVLQPGDGWSPWSEEYSQSGTLFRSPSPRRYFQLEAELLSQAPDAGVALEELVVHFSSPLARSALGEIQPLQVEPGVETEFTYFLRTDLESDSQGFDRIALEASVPLSYGQVLADGQPAQARIEPIEAGFRLAFPAPLTRGGLIEIRFAATVFQSNTRFRAFLEQEGGVRQQVDPGDAAPAVQGAGDVVFLPVDNALLARLDLGGGLFTPNGDGVNDLLPISFDVLKLFDRRPVRAAMYDLHGRLVRRLHQGEEVAGHYALSWDGRDQQGALVAPGLYLFRLEIEGDSLSRALVRAVGVSY